MPLARSDSFGVLTYPSRCCLQRVSAPRSFEFFPCPDLSLPMPSPASKYSLARFAFLLYSHFVLPTSPFSGSKLSFTCLCIFGILSVSSFLHFSEGEPFSFFCLPPVFSLLYFYYFSVTQLTVDKLRTFNSDVLLLFLLLLS